MLIQKMIINELFKLFWQIILFLWFHLNNCEKLHIVILFSFPQIKWIKISRNTKRIYALFELHDYAQCDQVLIARVLRTRRKLFFSGHSFGGLLPFRVKYLTSIKSIIFYPLQRWENCEKIGGTVKEERSVVQKFLFDEDMTKIFFAIFTWSKK